jgi:hypothetical protein
LIDTQDLLFACRFFAGQDACLDRGGVGFVPDEMTCGYAVLLEDLGDSASGVVLAEDSDSKRFCTQCPQVEESIPRASQREVFPSVGEDKHRGFSGNAAGCPIEILIEDKISPDDDLFLGEVVYDL